MCMYVCAIWAASVGCVSVRDCVKILCVSVQDRKQLISVE